uniref:Uncharacterized protein n=1 Tax=Cucumis sativus TaxID=3659 RepID=A0A0A0L8G0_CUCSA
MINGSSDKEAQVLAYETSSHKLPEDHHMNHSPFLPPHPFASSFTTQSKPLLKLHCITCHPSPFPIFQCRNHSLLFHSIPHPPSSIPFCFIRLPFSHSLCLLALFFCDFQRSSKFMSFFSPGLTSYPFPNRQLFYIWF